MKPVYRTISDAQFRAVMKQAFDDGFEAARHGTARAAWETAHVRKQIDYHGLFELLERDAKKSKAKTLKVGADQDTTP